MTELVVFDGDCTLYDTRYNLITSAYDAYKEIGYNVGKVAILAAFEKGHGPVQVFNELTPDVDAVGLEKLFYEADEALGIDNVSLYPGVEDCLISLAKSKIGLAVVTNRYHESTLKILDKFGISSFFVSETGTEYIVGADEVELPKPSPEGLIRIIGMTGVDHANVVYVGDTPGDMKTARGANVTPAAFTHGMGSRSSLISAGAKLTFEHHSELPELIELRK